MPPEIFASYSREDQAQVFPIVDKLRERGLNIWIDQEGIHGAKLWSQEIVNGIESSKVFILFASAKAFLSKNVTKELALASESDKYILPIFIEDAEIPPAMKYQLAGIQGVELFKMSGDAGLKYILQSLSGLGISVESGDFESKESELESRQIDSSQYESKASGYQSKKWASIIVLSLLAITSLFFLGGRTESPQQSEYEKPQNNASNQTVSSERDLDWYRTNAVPRIIKYVEKSEYDNAFSLASEINTKLPDDPLIKSLWDEFSAEIQLKITPADSIITYRNYSSLMDQWKPLRSKNNKLRLPFGAKLLHIEKEGYITSEIILKLIKESPQNELILELQKYNKSYEGMVYIPSSENRPILFGQHLFSEKPYLDGFLIDKYEVTNKDYKGFIDAGGYKRKEFWTHQIVGTSGKPIEWESAMKLFEDRTKRPGPATWELSNYPEGKGQFPVQGVSWYEAAAYALFKAKKLPSIHHWIQAAGINNSPLILPNSNLSRDSIKPVGELGGPSSWGVYDMAGNVSEWCQNPTEDKQNRFALGGAWSDAAYWFNFSNVQHPLTRNEKNGFRCVLSANSSKFPEKLFNPVPIIHRDFSNEKPCSDEIYEVYKKRFEYDKRPLEANMIQPKMDFERYTKETITFNAAYNNERVILHVFLPKSGKAPYQVIIGYPGSGAAKRKDSTIITPPSFSINSNRAYLFPVYKGTFERNDGMKSTWPDKSHTFANNLNKWVLDVRRTVDYVETREDLKRDKIAYHGFSWGSRISPFVLSAEKRIKTAILVVGGMAPAFALPEADQINYISRVHCPILMLNGRFDGIYPLETAQKPFFQLLGTDQKDKKHLIFETTHNVPNTDLNRESVEWLDIYLGPSNE